jgi:hypothetical protein
MNFLHFAILLFAACLLVLIAVSLMTAEPPPQKVAGLTWATAQEGGAPKRRLEDRLSSAFALALIATMIGLWWYFA